MFKQIFEVMNELLDEIIVGYPETVGASKHQLHDNLNMLKAMSDSYIEEWLLFEEKLSHFYAKQPPTKKESVNPVETNTDTNTDAYDQAHGYFTLMMFEQAVKQFEEIIEHNPDFTEARMYLALSYFQMGKQFEAYRHFKLTTSLTEDHKIQAICYHNMGCIQIKMQNLDRACEYFDKALEMDPEASFYSLS